MRPLDDALEADGTPFTMPGAEDAEPVRLARLHLDRATGASVSLVRFPAGWRRPGPGHYAVTEELLVLEGEIELGRPVRAAEHLLVPPYTPRVETRTEGGALVLAWFSGPPAWVDGEPDVAPPHGPVLSTGHGVLREDVAGLPGSYRVLTDPAPDPLPVDADVLDPAARAWAWVPAGTSLPAVPGLHVRTWA